MARAFKEVLKTATDVTVHAFPTEAAAREGLTAFRSTLREATPVESVMKTLFRRADVRRVAGENGEDVFKVFLHSETAATARDPVAHVMRALRKGDLDAVARSLDIEASELGTRAFRRRFSSYARDTLPDVRLAERVAAARRALPRGLAARSRDLRPSSVDELLRAIRGDPELERLVTRLSKHVAENGGKRFKYVSTFFVLSGVGASVAGVAAALHVEAKRSAGCWRVYLDPVTRRLRACKIVNASCRNRDTNETAACDRTPPAFTADMCRSASPGDECVHCDSTAGAADPKHHLPRSSYLESDDLYVCRPVASVGEMLGQVFADVPDMARDVVGEVAGAVSRVWGAVKYVLLAAFGTVVACLSLYAMLTAHRADGDGRRRAGGRAEEREPLLDTGSPTSSRRSVSTSREDRTA